MSCDKSRINLIEINLKKNPNGISTNDLIFYLKCNSNNKFLDENNLSITEEYLKKVNNSYFYENIFINKSNYTTICVAIIVLLIPFYYSFPRFYKLGFVGIFIGLLSFSMLYSTVTSLYKSFFSNIGPLFIGLSIFIYIIFFILLNKLNHISLFFISSVISFLIISYIIRLKLTIPIESNKYIQYKAIMNTNTNNNYTEYNLLLETTCYQIINRYKLQLPSGTMLYSYLTEFQIGTNNYKYLDFITNLFCPIISLFILWLLGFFLSIVKENEINIFPIIGINEESNRYLTCQANYILPKELNINLLIHDLINKYDLNDKIYFKVEKALLRISHELLKKYNPKFVKIENEDKKKIVDNLKSNKIYIEIFNLLKKNNTDFNFDYIDEIKKVIHDAEIPYKKKATMYDLLKHIDNTLLVINEFNESYNNDSILAKDELLYDKEIEKNIKGDLENIINIYIKNFKDNLNLKDGTLFGYHYNILTYNLFSNNVRIQSNNFLKNIIRLFSTWILFSKPFASSWLISSLMVSDKKNFTHLIKNLSSESIIWKYLGMGTDKSYFENAYNKLNKNEPTLLSEGYHFIYTLLAFFIMFPIIYFYNITVFGLTLDPSWYNILYQIVFILNIFGNMQTYFSEGSLVAFNIKFLIAFIFIIIFLSTIMYLISIFKK